MYFDDEFAFLFGARIDNLDLVFRIDRVETAFYTSYQNGALEVRLLRCDEVEKALAFFKANEGIFVWHYDFDHDKRTFSLSSDDGTEFTTRCDSIQESDSDLTIEELDKKLKSLSELLRSESDYSVELGGRFSKLDQMLNHEIANELNNLEAKREFFAKANPDRVESISHSIKFCNRLLNLKNEISRTDK